MSQVADKINKLLNEIPPHVKLIPISKTKPENTILEAYNSGFKIFGENKVQELARKHESLPGDIEWHMVGHLQSNKVKYLAPFIHLLHGIDSFKLLKVVNKEGEKIGRVINVLLQLHIATEETKFGLSEEEVFQIFDSEEFKLLENVKVIGVMGMATYTSDEGLIRKEFKGLSRFYEKIKSEYFIDNKDFKEISMGMSSDYKIAIEEGSTMIRIGSLIFGSRI